MSKASMRERYTELTRGLAWDPSYVTHEQLYPYTRFEGIKIHDWDKWEDPFRLTVDAYHKYQTEKDKRLYAVLDSFAQGSGHLQATDAATSMRCGCSSRASPPWSTPPTGTSRTWHVILTVRDRGSRR